MVFHQSKLPSLPGVRTYEFSSPNAGDDCGIGRLAGNVVQPRQALFQQISADSKDLDDIPHCWPHARQFGLPAIQYTAREVRSGLLFCVCAEMQCRRHHLRTVSALNSLAVGLMPRSLTDLTKRSRCCKRLSSQAPDRNSVGMAWRSYAQRAARLSLQPGGHLQPPLRTHTLQFRHVVW